MNKIKIEKQEVLRFLRLALILIAVVTFCSLVLFGVNKLKIMINQNRELAEDYAAMSVVLPVERYEPVENMTDVDPIVRYAYIAYKGDEQIGYCVKTAPTGYRDEIEMVTGVDMQGLVCGVHIISMAETQDVGTKTQDAEWLSQFIGKGEDVAIAGGEELKSNEVSAVAGATVSSKAVTRGVAVAVSTAKTLKGDE